MVATLAKNSFWKKLGAQGSELSEFETLDLTLFLYTERTKVATGYMDFYQYMCLIKAENIHCKRH